MNEEKIGLNFTKDKQFFDKSKQFMATTISNSTQISVKYGVLEIVVWRSPALISLGRNALLLVCQRKFKKLEAISYLPKKAALKSPANRFLKGDF